MVENKRWHEMARIKCYNVYNEQDYKLELIIAHKTPIQIQAI